MGRPERWIEVEVWEKDFTPDIDDGIVIIDNQDGTLPQGRFRKWNFKHDPQVANDTQSLGEPDEVKYITDFGIDFIPIVHAKFRDVGDDRGEACFDAVLDKIDEANRVATRLHQMQFRHNQPKWALAANAVDPISNRPIPAPQIGSGRTARADGEPNTVTIGGEVYVRLPGSTTLTPLVAQLDYSSMLATLQDHLAEVQKDLPELAYYELRSSGAELSGRAIRLLLSDAIDRVLEARGNAYQALQRANAMALTMGKNAGLFTDFDAAWSYEEGSFDHSFSDLPVIVSSKLEEAETELANVNAKIAKVDLGVDKTTLRTELGYTEDDIKKQDQAAEATAGDLSEDAVDQFIRGEL
jgi:hypothetical protein